MRTEIENPMVLGDYYTLPDVVCPHCGESWKAYSEPEIGFTLYEGSSITTSRPLTDSGKYCAACVGAAHKTDTVLLEWFDRNADWQRFMAFYLEQQFDSWNKPSKDKTLLLVELLRARNPDEFMGTLRIWVLDEPQSKEYADFEHWLMEVM